MEIESFNYKDQTRLEKDEKKALVVFAVIGLLLIVLIINAVYLYFLIRNQRPSITYQVNSAQSPQTDVSLPISPSPAFANSQANISPTISPSVVLSPTIVITPIPTVAQKPQIKDYFIPLGSGSSQASDWTNVPGAQVSLDFGQYPNIKQIVLEVTVDIPSANEYASVRLFNVTDQHPVWNSTVTINSGNSTAYLVSSPITYDTGQKTYQLQMLTQLESPANLSQARLHITLD